MSEIPGWISCRDYGEPNRIIQEHARTCVPENGVVLELGSMFGSTTHLLRQHLKYSAHIYVIDLWGQVPIGQLYKLLDALKQCHKTKAVELLTQIIHESHSEYMSDQDFYNWWKYFTKDLHNVTHFRNSVTGVEKHLIPDVDLIIQDAQHHYEGVLEELEYWWPKLKPGGTLIIDDYNRHAWPGVVEAAEEFFSKTWYGTKVPTDSKLLIVKKPGG